jgi:hypothetical protein
LASAVGKVDDSDVISASVQRLPLMSRSKNGVGSVVSKRFVALR